MGLEGQKTRAEGSATRRFKDYVPSPTFLPNPPLLGSLNFKSQFNCDGRGSNDYHQAISSFLTEYCHEYDKNTCHPAVLEAVSSHIIIVELCESPSSAH
jgi:hypothetical protein